MADQRGRERHAEAQQVFRQFAWNLAGSIAKPSSKGKKGATAKRAPRRQTGSGAR